MTDEERRELLRLHELLTEDIGLAQSRGEVIKLQQRWLIVDRLLTARKGA